MVDLNLTISAIILNVNGLNIPIKKPLVRVFCQGLMVMNLQLVVSQKWGCSYCYVLIPTPGNGPSHCFGSDGHYSIHCALTITLNGEVCFSTKWHSSLMCKRKSGLLVLPVLCGGGFLLFLTAYPSHLSLVTAQFPS